MVHDGVVITESIDILRYIEERFPEPALYPPDEAGRRKVDEWMDLATERHIAVVKTYMYAMAFDSKSEDVMDDYVGKRQDEDLLAFHQESAAKYWRSFRRALGAPTWVQSATSMRRSESANTGYTIPTRIT